MKWTVKQKLEVQEHVGRWLDYLGLSPMTVYYHFQTKDSGSTIMSIKEGYPYNSCNLYIYPEFLKDETKDRVICHELMHQLIGEVVDKRLSADSVFEDAIESYVDRMAHVIVYNLKPIK